MRAGAIADFADDLCKIPINALKLATVDEVRQREFMAEAAFRS